MTLEGLSYSQQYWIKRNAKELGMSPEAYMASPNYKPKRRRGVKTVKIQDISMDRVKRLDNLFVNEDMLRVYKTGLEVDRMFSHEGGIPVGTNVMCTGDPGVGKTTLLMHALSALQAQNPDVKCLFISAEMSKIQVFKYLKRFPQFSNLNTLFTSDFLDYNMKDVIQQALKQGYDYVLIDSIVEVLDSLKEDNKWSQGQAEKWLIDLCVKNNEAKNDLNKYTTFLLIQQVTKNGIFVGSNKLKHITDAHMEMKRDSDNDGGGTYIMFSKNRNGAAGIRYNFRLGANQITYDTQTQTESKPQVEFQLSNEDLTF